MFAASLGTAAHLGGSPQVLRVHMLAVKELSA